MVPCLSTPSERQVLCIDQVQISQVPVKREEGWICLTATGLNIIGRIGHQLFANAALQQNWKQYAAKVADPQAIDWKRSAPMWQSNIVQGNKLLTQQGPVKRAYEQVAHAIGLPGAVPVQQPVTAPDTKEPVNA